MFCHDFFFIFPLLIYLLFYPYLCINFVMLVVLGDGSDDFDNGGFLEGVDANHAPGDLAGDGDDGDVVH